MSDRDKATQQMTSTCLRAGEQGAGEFHCAGCAYGIVVVSHELPTCPMCGGVLWEASTWSPFSRTDRLEVM
jgi:hypothetical protein